MRSRGGGGQFQSPYGFTTLWAHATARMRAWNCGTTATVLLSEDDTCSVASAVREIMRSGRGWPKDKTKRRAGCSPRVARDGFPDRSPDNDAARTLLLARNEWQLEGKDYDEIRAWITEYLPQQTMKRLLGEIRVRDRRISRFEIRLESDSVTRSGDDLSLRYIPHARELGLDQPEVWLPEAFRGGPDARGK